MKLASLISFALCGMMSCDIAPAASLQALEAPPPSEQDGEFMVRAVEASRQQVSEAHVASQSTRRTQIQATARSIASDHAHAIRRLVELARRKGMDIPRDVGLRRDVAGSGESDPDRIAGFLKAHEAAVALFHQEAVRGMDPDLKRFARATLPTLQRRLAALRSLQDMYPPNMDPSRSDG
jgi:putative membrane protein